MSVTEKGSLLARLRRLVPDGRGRRARSDPMARGEEMRWEPGDRRALGLITFSHAIQHFYQSGLAIAYPFVLADLHVSFTALGVILSLSGVLGGVLQGAAGFVRRASARLLLGGQNLLLAVASVLGGMAPSFALFGGARVFGGVVQWPQHPVGSAYLAERLPKRRGLALSWHTTGGSIGTVIVPVLAGAMIQAWGWRRALIGLALPLALGGLLLAVKLPEDRQPDVLDRSVERVRTTPLRKLFTRRRVLGILAASMVSAAGRGLGVLASYVPAYLRKGLHLSALMEGTIFTVVVVGSIVGPVVAGHLSDRIGRRPVLLLTYVIGAATIAGFVLVGSSILALAAMGFVMGVFAYAESPLLQSMFADAVEDADSRGAFGLFFALAYGIGSAWLAAVGAVIDAAGFHAAFYLMGGSFLVAAAIVALVV